MKRRYETRCWLCQSKNLEPDARGMRCKSCGATFSFTPNPTIYPLTQHFDLATGQTSASPAVAIQHKLKD